MKAVVLIVEDEFMLRYQLAEEFREAGFVVLEACKLANPLHNRRSAIAHSADADQPVQSGWSAASLP